MKRTNPFSADEDITALKRVCLSHFDSDTPRLTSLVIKALPPFSLPLIGDFLSNNKDDPVKYALCGEQPITLCLSQDVTAKLGTRWSLGFLPPDQQWDSWQVEVDKQFPITDVERCLRFLRPTNSSYCRIAVKVLVVKLSMTSSNSPSALDDLRNTIGELQRHLNSVKHVVFSIDEYTSCCFTFKNAIGNVVLLQIIDDLEACWSPDRRTLTPVDLFAFYFTSGIQRASEKYLAKLVISLNHPLNRALFRKEASQMQSNKIMWVTSLKSYDDFNDIEENSSHLCHAIRLDMPNFLGFETDEIPSHCWEHALRFENNPIIERIVINSHGTPFGMNLPRPSALLTDATRLSALVELTLTGGNNTLHLTQLNNGYFPLLAHMTFIGGNISGHLDSGRVPCLETLRIELNYGNFETCITTNFLAREKTHSLIHAGRPWQLVASKEPGGWSLASYNELTTHSQEELKDDTVHPHSPTLIRELMFVMDNQSNANEWHSQLRGSPSLEAAAGDHDDRLLVWAPQYVQKITAFCTNELSVQLEFNEPILEQIPILTSLTCHGADIVLNGDALPNLQSLELNAGEVSMSGAFPHLEALFFEKANFESGWQLAAPKLQSFSCRDVRAVRQLSLDLRLLPKLSFLQIKPMEDNYVSSPQLFGDKHNWTTLRLKRVVLDQIIARSDLLEDSLVSNVLHLELGVNACKLPVCWFNTEWQCETLKIIAYALPPWHVSQWHTPDMMVLPLLPQVKRLTVVSQDFLVLLDKEMPKLVNCTVPSPKSLGPNLKCPALERILFTDELPEDDKKKCLDRATYKAMGSEPKKVSFAFDCQVHKMTWDVAQNESQVLPFDQPPEAIGNLKWVARNARSFVNSVSSSFLRRFLP